METQKISIIANRILEALTLRRIVSIEELSSEMKMETTLICMGIGWLARESSITITQDKGIISVQKDSDRIHNYFG